MSDDREREHCLNVVEEWADNPHLRLSDLFARERAAAAAEARDKNIATLEQMATEATSPEAGLALERAIRALKGGGR